LVHRLEGSHLDWEVPAVRDAVGGAPEHVILPRQWEILPYMPETWPLLCGLSLSCKGSFHSAEVMMGQARRVQQQITKICNAAVTKRILDEHFVSVLLNQTEVLVLIDSGASKSLIAEEMVYQLV